VVEARCDAEQVAVVVRSTERLVDPVHAAGDLVVAEIDESERQFCSHPAERIPGLGRQVERRVEVLDGTIVVIAQTDDAELPVVGGGVPSVVGRLGKGDGPLCVLCGVGTVESRVGERSPALNDTREGR
jgi:hypothetical protein